MNWGDAPGWGALAVAVFCAAYAVKARGDAKEANRQAERSASAAEAANEDGRRSADAAERSVVVAEQALAEQRREADERRTAEAEATQARVELVIERPTEYTFRIRNEGKATATGVSLAEQSTLWTPPPNRPVNVSLPHRDAVEFHMFKSYGAPPIPGTVYVTWDGQSQPVPLPVPDTWE